MVSVWGKKDIFLTHSEVKQISDESLETTSSSFRRFRCFMYFLSDVMFKLWVRKKLIIRFFSLAFLYHNFKWRKSADDLPQLHMLMFQMRELLQPQTRFIFPRIRAQLEAAAEIITSCSDKKHRLPSDHRTQTDIICAMNNMLWALRSEVSHWNVVWDLSLTSSLVLSTGCVHVV